MTGREKKTLFAKFQISHQFCLTCVQKHYISDSLSFFCQMPLHPNNNTSGCKNRINTALIKNSNNNTTEAFCVTGENLLLLYFITSCPPRSWSR